MPTLRDWLTLKQRETRRGRAELRLEERLEVWNLQPRADYLPPWWRPFWRLRIAASGPRLSGSWCARRCDGRPCGACSWRPLSCCCWRGRGKRTGRIRARTLVDRLIAAETPRVPAILRELAPYRRPASSLLRQSLLTAPTGSTAATNLELALLDGDPSQADALLERALVADEAALLR